MCFKSARMSDVTALLITALEQSELPALKEKMENGDGASLKIQQRLLNKLEKEMEDYRKQEEKQYEFLETGRYTPEKFDERNALLRQKMEECQKQIASAKQSLPKAVDYEKKIIALETAIAALKDDSKTPDAKNKLLKPILERVEMFAEGGENRGETDISLKVFLRL